MLYLEEKFVGETASCKGAYIFLGGFIQLATLKRVGSDLTGLGARSSSANSSSGTEGTNRKGYPMGREWAGRTGEGGGGLHARTAKRKGPLFLLSSELYQISVLPMNATFSILEAFFIQALLVWRGGIKTEQGKFKRLNNSTSCI